MFVTHLTPFKKRSKLRSALQKIYFKALQNQTYNNWKVLLIGEEEKKNRNFHEVSIGNYNSDYELSERLADIYERPEIINLFEEADFIIKLDDDDLISPTILSKVKDLDFDVYYDLYHVFYDVTSGKISRQKRNWLASTCIHKREHACAKIHKIASDNIYRNSLLYSDHSLHWHSYYADKNGVAAGETHPIYLRILSPSSISSNLGNSNLNFKNPTDFFEYDNYLKSFGTWENYNISEFDNYKNELATAWQMYTGNSLRQLNLHGSFELFLQFLKSKILK